MSSRPRIVTRGARPRAPPPAARPFSAAYKPRTKNFANVSRDTDEDVLEVLRQLLQIQDNNRANEPVRNNLTVLVLESFKDRLVDSLKDKTARRTEKKSRLIKEIEDVVRELKKKKGQAGRDMAMWLAERIRNSSSSGFDLVCKLEGDGWPVQVGRTMHLKMQTADDLLSAMSDKDGLLLQRVTSIIQNQRGITTFRPSPLRMSVKPLHVDLVDGDEEDETQVADLSATQWNEKRGYSDAEADAYRHHMALTDPNWRNTTLSATQWTNMRAYNEDEAPSFRGDGSHIFYAPSSSSSSSDASFRAATDRLEEAWTESDFANHMYRQSLDHMAAQLEALVVDEEDN